MRIDGSRVFNPGLARHRISVMGPIPATPVDSLGAPIGSRPVVCTTYARIQGMQGREMTAVQQQWADARFKVEMQWAAGITTDMQIVDDEGRTLNIRDCQDPTGTRAMLVLYCSDVK